MEEKEINYIYKISIGGQPWSWDRIETGGYEGQEGSLRVD
jgi:hypothetical protein